MTVDSIRSTYRKRYGSDPDLVAVAPGRVNLIGEHTDYNDGFVFPAAIDRVTLVALGRTEGLTELFSEQTQEAKPFDVTTAEPKQLEDWGKYPAGMGWAMRKAGYMPINVKGVVSSTIPMGSGVSSSAALEMAFGVAWNQFGGFGIDKPALAKLGKVCENQFIGVNSGIMDQMASAMGRDKKAMFLDTRSLEIEYASIPDGLVIVLCDTKKPRALTDSAYNERRSQCEEAARIMGVSMLRDATIAGLEHKRSEMSEVVYRRARHVITENDRCQQFRTALDTNALVEVGQLMHDSHVSLRDDYEVSCRELDAMAEAAWKAPGCVGARMTGAGFGGACVALVKASELNFFTEATLSTYRNVTNISGEAISCGVVEGARVI